MTDLTPDEYEKTLINIDRLGIEHEGRLMVRARCAPHITRISAKESAYANITSGCIAGRGYIRISPEGQVTPCPYIPPAKATPSILDIKLDKILNTELFEKFAKPVYNGKCRECEFKETCGGCRARALAASGDVMGEDPWCAYIPDKENSDNPTSVVWNVEAKERLKRIPIFLRRMVRTGVEAYAKKKNIQEITPELMASLREKFKGGRPG
jgi:radical SAM protein with 4Fe4S-binding SPASM domain